MRNPDGPKGPEQSAEALGQAPDARAEHESGPEAQRATKDIRDIARSITSAERLLTSSSSLKELRDDKVREALKTKRSGLKQRLKKLSAVALAGMMSIGALLQGESDGRAEGQAKTSIAEVAEPRLDDIEGTGADKAVLTEEEHAALLGLVLAISEQLRQGQQAEGANGAMGTAETTVTDEDEPVSPEDPFAAAWEKEEERKADEEARKIDDDERRAEREQGAREMDDHATDQVATYVNELLATNPERLAESLRMGYRSGRFYDLASIDEAPNRGVEFSLFEQKMHEALTNLKSDIEGKMRNNTAEMTAAERKIAAVLAEEERRRANEG